MGYVPKMNQHSIISSAYVVVLQKKANKITFLFKHMQSYCSAH